MSLRSRTIASTIAVALAAAVGFAEAVPSADELLRRIESDGARVVSRRLSATPTVFDEICNQIETARPDWLEVARALKPASDGSAALSLNYSVARALLVDPGRVLGLVGHGFAVRDICTSPFTEPAPGVAERYRRSAVEALSRPLPNELKSVRDDCMKEIHGPPPTVSDGLSGHIPGIE